MRNRTASLIALLLAGLAPTAALADALAPSASEPEAPAKQHELSLGWSPRLMQRHDEIFSPRPARGGSAFGLSFGHEWEGEKTAHRSGLDFMKALAKTRPLFEYSRWPTGETQQTEATPFTALRLDHAVLRRVAVPGPFTLHLGGAADLDFQHFDWVWHPLAIGGYTGLLSLDARAEVETHLGARHELRLAVSTPLLAWVTRSPYAANDAQLIWNNREANPVKTFFRYLSQGQVRTVDSHQGLRVKLRYAYHLTPRYGLVLTAHGRLVHLTEPRPLMASEWGVTLATAWSF
ncbi:MAG: hypothetical protein P1V51_15000 [Deltaproteobacteria bacterium]|nr:hypothetical protein [Deltaproteobacteria bacterium]